MSMDKAAEALPRFAYRACAEQRGEPVDTHPVIIVGGGLSGLALACDLATRGIRSVVLDEDDTIGVRGMASRGICYARKTLQVLARLGIYQRIQEKGAVWSVGRVLDEDGEIYAFTLPGDEASAYPPFINIQQYYIEWFLVDRLNELGLTELRWKNEVTDCRREGDEVVLTVTTPDGPYETRGAWVVACDGANSRLRTLIGMDPHRERYPDHWCITDVRPKVQPEGPVERFTWVSASFNEGRGAWKHRMADDVWRLDFQLGADADMTIETTEARVMERARGAFDGIEVEPVSVLVWTYYAQLTDSFRDGRILLCGDAGHAFSPFGARGGNSGIQDAENLAWKLALVLKGQAGEALLDSYSTERRAAAAHNIAVTRRSNRFLAPQSAKELAMRAALLKLSRKYPFARRLINTGRLSDPFVYAGSPLTESGGENLDDVRLGEATLLGAFATRDGFRGLWRPVGTPDPDLVRRFASLAQGMVPVETRVLDGGISYPGVPGIADPGGRLAERFAIPPGGYLLLRPDDHVAARLSPALPAAVEAALDRALARETAA